MLRNRIKEMRKKRRNRFIAIAVVVIITFIVLVNAVSLVAISVANEIRERGLKGIATEIWEGEK